MAFNCVDTFNHQDVLAEVLSQKSEAMVFSYSQELGFLRLFYLCGRKWSKAEYTQPTLYKIEEFFHEKAEEIDCFLVRVGDNCRPTEEDYALFFGSRKMVSEILRKIETFDQEIKECYLTLSNGSLQTSCSPEVRELLGILDSLVKNSSDILWDDTFDEALEQQMEAHEESLRFLWNMVRFARFRGLEYWQMQGLSNHAQVLVLNCSLLSCKFFYITCGGDLPRKVSELVGKTKPFESMFVRFMLGAQRALMLSRSSHTATAGNDKSMLGGLC